jgi:uncharacterized membrane protein
MSDERTSVSAIAETIVPEKRMPPSPSQNPARAQSKSDFISKHRMEALADGVFAIVMTLLVLDLKVPELQPPVTAHALAHAIASQRTLFFSFAMTFVLATVFWMLHQKTLRLLHNLDKATVFLSLAPMLFVSLLPFSTATFGRYLENATASALYFGNQFAIAFLVFCLWFKTHSPDADSEERQERRILGVRVGSLALACLCGALVAFRKPEYASTAFAIAFGLSRFAARRVLRIWQAS